MTPAPEAFLGRAARRHLPSGLATPRRRLSQRTRHLGRAAAPGPEPKTHVGI